MQKFCLKVDCQMLNNEFHKVIVAQYEEKVKDHHKYVPKELSKYMEILSESTQYKRLITCISEWLAVMELCDDLLQRVKVYGIAHYLDE